MQLEEQQDRLIVSRINFIIPTVSAITWLLQLIIPSGELGFRVFLAILGIGIFVAPLKETAIADKSGQRLELVLWSILGKRTRYYPFKSIKRFSMSANAVSGSTGGFCVETIETGYFKRDTIFQIGKKVKSVGILNVFNPTVQQVNLPYYEIFKRFADYCGKPYEIIDTFAAIKESQKLIFDTISAAKNDNFESFKKRL